MKYKPIERVDYLVVHCAATRPSMDIGVAEIRRWHKRRGFFDVGYHYVIRRDGTVEPGRPPDRPGAHARGFNRRSISVCLVGGVKENNVKVAEDNFTEAQKDALYGVLAALRSEYPKSEVLGHRDLPDVHKSCPSFDVRSWLEEQDAYYQID